MITINPKLAAVSGAIATPIWWWLLNRTHQTKTKAPVTEASE
jgi:hypothetical protein